MIKIKTFGFKSGDMPAVGGFSFDVRHLRNPHNDLALRPLDGRDQRVQDFVLRDPKFDELYPEVMFHALSFKDPTIVFGCFGGRHRSVACAEIIAKSLRDKGHEVEITHRELEA